MSADFDDIRSDIRDLRHSMRDDMHRVSLRVEQLTLTMGATRERLVAIESAISPLPEVVGQLPARRGMIQRHAPKAGIGAVLLMLVIEVGPVIAKAFATPSASAATSQSR